MIEYIRGTIAELTPASLILENQGTGYFLNISLSTYSKLEGKVEYKVLVHEVIREDSHLLYGFADREERDVFRHLISVNGVGAGTARMMLSSLNPADIQKAVAGSDVNLLKSIKGIGLKTAQRIIVDLKDKLGRQAGAGEIFAVADNTKRDEALSALVMLGFAKGAVAKVLDRIIREDKPDSVENLIRQALKNL